MAVPRAATCAEVLVARGVGGPAPGELERRLDEGRHLRVRLLHPPATGWSSPARSPAWRRSPAAPPASGSTGEEVAGSLLPSVIARLGQRADLAAERDDQLVTSARHGDREGAPVEVLGRVQRGERPRTVLDHRRLTVDESLHALVLALVDDVLARHPALHQIGTGRSAP